MTIFDALLATPPDFWVGCVGDEQLKRWYVVPKNDESNVFLHLFLKDDPILHDHPFESTSFILTGTYREYFADGSYADRAAGDIVWRDATTPHRIVLPLGPAVSLFVTGPRLRDWGFIYPDGWSLGVQDPAYANRHWAR